MESDLLDHNAVLRAAARSALTPLGLRQVGRSRIWLDDRVWSLLVVEFQASSWSKGSYLNVGAMWLWRRTDHFRFDYGHRVKEFVAAETDAWVRETATLADQAAARVIELRAEVSDLSAAARILDRTSAFGGWPGVNAAVAHALLGDPQQARRLLRHQDPGSDGDARLKELTARKRQLDDWLDDPAAFRSEIVSEINRNRAALRLAELPTGDVDAALSARDIQ